MPVDYYLPGSPEERFAVGYFDGTNYHTKTNSAQQNNKNMPSKTINLSKLKEGTLKAEIESTWQDKMVITQVIYFNDAEKFYRNEVKIKNISADPMQKVRYMRNFDPDNTVFRGGSYTTENEILKTFEAGDGMAVVRAQTIDGDPLNTALSTKMPIFYFSEDPRAKISTFGFTNTDPFVPYAYDAAMQKGYKVTADQAISVTCDAGALAPGAESEPFVYYTSLDDRIFDTVLPIIKKREEVITNTPQDPAGSTDFTVKFVDDDGITELKTETVRQGRPATPPTSPTKSGYTFFKWVEDTGSLDNVQSNIIAKAQYETIAASFQRTVKFESNGGTIIPDVIVKKDTPVKEPIIPEKSGNRFKGWTKTNGGTDLWSFTLDKVTLNPTTLYASWEDVSSKRIFETVQAVDAVKVESGTTGVDALAMLPKKITIYDDKKVSEETDVVWSFRNPYDGNIVGPNDVIGTLTLPTGTFWKDDYPIKASTVVTVLGTANITISANPSIGGTVSGGGVFKAGKDVTVVATPNVGYDFVNWTEGTSEASKDKTYTFKAENDRNLVANFGVKKYNLNYIAGANGTVSGMSPQTVEHRSAGSAVTAVASSGYHFVRWSDGVTTATRTDSNITANISVTAVFAVNKYKITFDGNGSRSGSVPTDDTEYEPTSVVTIPGNSGMLKRTGYDFNGWCLDKNGNDTYYVESDTYVVPSNNVAFYALWKANGETFLEVDPTEIRTGEGTQTRSFVLKIGGNSIIKAVEAKHITLGGDFSGLALTVDGNTESEINITISGDISKKGTGSITLDPVVLDKPVTGDLTDDILIKGEFTVMFLDHLGNVISEQDIEYGKDAVLPTAPTWEHHIFTDWDKDVKNVTQNLTVRAQYNAVSFKVTFNTNGGSSVAEATVNYGEFATKPVVPTMSGYSFGGWYKDDKLTAPWVFETDTVTDNTILYAKWSKNSSGGGSKSPVNKPVGPTEENYPVIVDGKKQEDTAIIKTDKNDDGQTVSKVTIDEKKTKDIVDKLTSSKSDEPVVTVPVGTKSDVVVGELNGQNVKFMEQKNAVLEIKTNKADYALPAKEINIDAVSKKMGTSVTLSDIKVRIEIAKPTADVIKTVEQSASKSKLSLVSEPVQFNVSCTYGGKTVDVSKFNSYVTRYVAIPDGVDPNKITTGIVVNSDGTNYHVPTYVTVIDGKYYAVINSLTNSTYAVVWHPLEFDDVKNHWAKKAVNDMGSRMVVYGVENGDYLPNDDITRAEFAAIMVRGLGLKPGTGENKFSDVNKGTWYEDCVKTATTYDLIKGYGNGDFGPNDKITREQAMTMIARAMKTTELESSFTDSEMKAILASFKDSYKAASYAKNSITACLKTGVVFGKNGKLVAPKDYITRAEVAAVMQRLLQKSELIDKK